MAQVAKDYLQCWADCGSAEELKGRLGRVMSPKGINFRADGVVHMEDRTKSKQTRPAAPEAANVIENRAARAGMRRQGAGV